MCLYIIKLTKCKIIVKYIGIGRGEVAELAEGASPGKQVYGITVSGVQIPSSPPVKFAVLDGSSGTL